jgi:hypothetical protein
MPGRAWPGGVAAGGALIGGLAVPGPPSVADVLCCWPYGFVAGGFLAGPVSVNLDEGPELMAMQTLMFLFADIEGPATVAQRLAGAYPGVRANHNRLIRAGLAAHGG